MGVCVLYRALLQHFDVLAALRMRTTFATILLWARKELSSNLEYGSRDFLPGRCDHQTDRAINTEMPRDI